MPLVAEGGVQPLREVERFALPRIKRQVPVGVFRRRDAEEQVGRFAECRRLHVVQGRHPQRAAGQRLHIAAGIAERGVEVRPA